MEEEHTGGDLSDKTTFVLQQKERHFFNLHGTCIFLPVLHKIHDPIQLHFRNETFTGDVMKLIILIFH